MKTNRLFIKVLFLTLCLSTFCFSCTSRNKTNNNKTMNNNAEIYLAGGCFWGTEHYLKQINGVLKTEVGYANGNIKNPTYREVYTDATGFAEAVRVEYNPEVLPLSLLLQLYFESIDPTSVNQQGNDRGSQYRTGVYYTNKEDLPLIRAELTKLEGQYSEYLAVEVLPLRNFYTAEEYHQNYLDKNPTGYCHLPKALFEHARKANDSTAKPIQFKRATTEELKNKLTALQYEVTQHEATERPFENEYNKEFRPGIYVDITTGEPLFLSSDKFESGCGWPAFSKPIDNHLLNISTDTSHGMVRNEVKSKKGNAHLGHVFEDGPTETGGLRYCINSASLRFIPKEEMEKEGYGAYIKLITPPKPHQH